MEQRARRVRVDGRDAGKAEVIPPSPADGTDDPLIGFMSVLMDTAFQVPGTTIRFGIDPIVGLIPVLGDYAMAIVSVVLISLSARYGLPRIVLARMVFNIILTTLIGLVPAFGDVFMLWYKPNARNYALFRKHAGPHPVSTATDWVFVVGLIGGAVFVLLLGLSAMLWLLHALFSIVNGGAK